MQGVNSNVKITGILFNLIFKYKRDNELEQACQTEGPPRATWLTFVLSWGPHTTTNWSHLIKIIAEYFYYLNLETYNVHSWMWTTHVYPV